MGSLVYNVSVLIGPDGELVGKYRKVCLPRGEIEAGIMPGNEYPVFDTRFGKVGMMIAMRFLSRGRTRTIQEWGRGDRVACHGLQSAARRRAGL